jgi:hypothetical protein
MDKKFSVSELIARQEEVSRETVEVFGQLASEQLNWKPSPEEWSVAQCFEHLIATNKPYFPVVEKIIKGEKKTTLWERVPVLPGFFGPLIINAVDPKSVKKVGARPGFIPSSSAIDAKIINEFVETQNRLIELMQQTVNLSVQEIIVTSPVASVFTYSLLDAYTIMALHNRRHFNQAKRVMESQGFPVAVAKSPAYTEAGI